MRRLFAALELPPCAACIGVDRCQTPFTAPPGLYRLSIEVFAAAPECGPACECEGPQGAHCWLQRPVLEPTPVKLSIDVDHPNARDVSIVVE